MNEIRIIGSDFEHPEDLILGPPWQDNSPDGLLVRSGRQGLRLVARALPPGGKIWAPEFHCESMIEPFLAEGCAVDFYALDEQLWPYPEHLLQIEDASILYAPYFGRSAPEAVTKAIAHISEQTSTPLVIDDTHSVFESTDPSTFKVASLRKLLPLGEGALVRPISDRHKFPLPRVEGSYTIREQAAIMRQSSHSHFGRSRELFQEAEAELVRAVEPQSANSRMIALWSKLRLSELSQRRHENSVDLIHLLGTPELSEAIVPLHGYGAAVTPAFLTCTLQEPVALQQFLAARSIYCPIHWPESNLASGRTWRTDLISFPIDHRYTSDDMMRIATAVSHFFLGDKP